MGKKKKLNMKSSNGLINTSQVVQSQIASAAIAEKVAREFRDLKQK